MSGETQAEIRIEVIGGNRVMVKQKGKEDLDPETEERFEKVLKGLEKYSLADLHPIGGGESRDEEMDREDLYGTSDQVSI